MSKASQSKADGAGRKLNKKQLSRERSIGLLSEAAFRLFVLHGYHATTLEAIASEADLTKGAVYFYFGSKENLVLHLFEVLREEIVAPQIEAIRKSDGGMVDKVIGYIHCGANFGVDRPQKLLFMIQMGIEFGEQDNAIAKGIKRLYKDLYDELEGVVEVAQTSGDVSRDVKPKVLASMIIAVHDGMMLQYHLRRREISGPELVRHVREMLLHGLGKV